LGDIVDMVVMAVGNGDVGYTSYFTRWIRR
jgi:hypothetical protein